MHSLEKILDDLKTKKIISTSDYKKLLNSLDTITFVYKAGKKPDIQLSLKSYLITFFHLRAGTYDIEVDRYRNKINTYKIEI